MRKLLKKSITILTAFFMLFSSCDVAFAAQTVCKSTSGTLTQDNQDEYHGFELVSTQKVPEISSDVMMFKHIKTGAKLMYVKNDDTQRVFSISFHTPAVDNTGVNHIIEHSLLDGSKNYPVKSPFKEMLKGSLGTFINAMTGDDYTTFPVASTNEQDLKNLMGVYLDAVFYPNVTSDPEIFKQEGWRYELPTKDSKLSVNGVVYNEMRGDYSKPAWLLNDAVKESLFPDTNYKWDSGGDPDTIPTLTRDKLISTYKKNYSPSNSYIYLYGKLDISQYLKFIDENYLSKFDKTDVDTSLDVQKPFTEMAEKTVSYPVSQGADTNKKTYLSLNFVTGNIEDKETNVALSFLNYLLTGVDNAPLKKALNDAHIAENVNSSFNMQGVQPVLSIEAVNADESSKEAFKKTIFDTLEDLSKNGFDKDYLKSALASYDIGNRETKLVTPMLGGEGLILSQTALSTWLYGKDPTMYFETDSVIKKIKNEDLNKYFENLINKVLLSNKHCSMVVLKPEAGLESKKENDEALKLQDYKSKIGEDGVSKLVKDTEDFNAWQKSGDSKEALASIPKLSLKDIKPELPDLKYDVEDMDGVKVLTHNTNLNGVSNINLYFDTSKVPQNKLHYMSLLSAVLSNVGTDKHSYDELSNEMMQYMGAPVAFGTSATADSKNPDKYNPKMSIALMVPDENISKAFDITKEIINESNFNDKEKIRQIIKQDKAALDMLITSGTGTLAASTLKSYMYESGRYEDELTGLSYYEFLKDLDDNFDARWEDISKNLKDTCSIVFNKHGLVASQSGSKDGNVKFKSELKDMIPKLSDKTLPDQEYKFSQPTVKTAFSSAVKVQTIIQAGKFKDAGYKYSGKMMVLQNVLDTGYLWNKVRTSGGAYGVESSISSDGMVALVSMRDPNLPETLQAFKGSVDYLKNFKATDDEMQEYIVGAIKSFVNLKSTGPLLEGALCDSMYLSNASTDDILKAESEALSTTPEDIRNYGDMLDKILKQNIYFVEGSKDKIDQNKQMFNKIVDTGK